MQIIQMIDTAAIRTETLEILKNKGYKIEENLNVLTINDNIEIEGLLSDSNIEFLSEIGKEPLSSHIANIVIDQYEYATKEL